MSAGGTPEYRLNYNGYVKEEIKRLFRLAVMVGVRDRFVHFSGSSRHSKMIPRRGVIQSIGCERCA